MSQKLNSKVAVIGIGIGKNSFHIVGQDSCTARPDHTVGSKASVRPGAGAQSMSAIAEDRHRSIHRQRDQARAVRLVDIEFLDCARDGALRVGRFDASEILALRADQRDPPFTEGLVKRCRWLLKIKNPASSAAMRS